MACPKVCRRAWRKEYKKLYQAFKDPRLVFEADQLELKALMGDAKTQAIKEKKFSFEPEEVIKVVERRDKLCMPFGPSISPKAKGN